MLRSTVRAEKGKLAEIRDETCNDLVSSKSKIRTSDKIPEIFDASEIGPRTTFENLARCIRLVSHNDKKQKRRKKTTEKNVTVKRREIDERDNSNKGRPPIETHSKIDFETRQFRK